MTTGPALAAVLAIALAASSARAAAPATPISREGSSTMQNASTTVPGGRLEWRRLPDLPDPLGVAGCYVGTHKGALVVAGGANFPTPGGGDRWTAIKIWHAAVWVLTTDDQGGHEWIAQPPLSRPMGYGATASTPLGVVMIGGEDGSEVFDTVTLLAWNPALRRLERHPLPALPEPRCFGGAAAIGSTVYVACGQHGANRLTADATVYRLDLTGFDPAADGPRGPKWERLPDVPGGPRTAPVVVSRAAQTGPRLCVLSGRRPDQANGDAAIEPLCDAHEFDPAVWEAAGRGLTAAGWKRLADMPAPRMAGTAVPLPGARIAVLSGDDGRLFSQTSTLKDEHPGFPRGCLVHDAGADAWSVAGDSPTCQLATTIAPWDGGHALVTGEVRPRVRTPAAWLITPLEDGSQAPPRPR